MRKQLLKMMFKKHHLIWNHDDSFVSRRMKAFYWIKTIICIILDRNRDLDYRYFSMLAWGFYSPASWEYGGEGWDELAVGEGVFTGWGIMIFGNSTV